MQTHGTVSRWLLVVTQPDGMKTKRFHSWETATDGFREAVKERPISARVYAVQARSNRYIKTWDYEQ